MASSPRLVGENEVENAGTNKLKEFITPSQQTISVLKVTSLWIAQLNRNSKEKEKKRKESPVDERARRLFSPFTSLRGHCGGERIVKMN